MYSFTEEEQKYLDSVERNDGWWKENTPGYIVHSAAKKYCWNILLKWRERGDPSNLEWVVKAYGEPGTGT